MKGLTGIVLGACCAIVIACASASKTSMSGSPAPQTSDHQQTPMPGSPRHDEIEKLAQEIETQRVALSLPQPAHTAQPMTISATAPTLTCKPTTDACTQSCTLADSICSNAKKICDIATQLDGDQWAAQKCSDSSQTCKDATARCCDCSK